MRTPEQIATGLRKKARKDAPRTRPLPKDIRTSLREAADTIDFVDQMLDVAVGECDDRSREIERLREAIETHRDSVHWHPRADARLYAALNPEDKQ